MIVQTLKSISTKKDGESVYTAGWIRTIRQSKKIIFIEIHDGTTFSTTQLVIEDHQEAFLQALHLTIGSCIRVYGNVKTGREGKHNYEIHVSKIVIEGLADTMFPLQKKRHSFEYLRTIPHLRMRTNTFYAVFKVRSVLVQAIHKFLEAHDFVYIQSPAITTTDAEGAGEVFRITTLDVRETYQDYQTDFFGKPTFLSVTGQLNLEPFIAGFRNVYTFGPSFRAEKSNTTRHVAEFWQVEPEMAFVNLEALIDFIEQMSKYMIRYVLEHAAEEIEFFDTHIESGLMDKLRMNLESVYAKVSYKEAIKIISDHSDLNISQGLKTEHERFLSDVHFQKPVFVTDYPKDEKAFYMKQNEDGTVAATDLLFPKLGEVVGASERESDYAKLERRIQELGLRQEEYSWYLETRKFGSCEHSGFGIGIERFLLYITGMDNIRDVIAYPRTLGHASF